ncbi:MAG: LAGLIDADG family homing endonuclease, partial [Niallia sp.]
MEQWEAAYLAGIIDGEGSITLTKMHKGEYRRLCITIPSTDKELLDYLHQLIGGVLIRKKNYEPDIHKNSYTLVIKKKNDVFFILERISPFLRIHKKRNRALWILNNYNKVTPRNGKYNKIMLKEKQYFE